MPVEFMNKCVFNPGTDKLQNKMLRPINKANFKPPEFCERL